MPTLLKARSVVGAGFPPDEGARLAQHLLDDSSTTWDDLTIDVRDMPPALLISAFFNGFLERIKQQRAPLLDKARKTKWLLAFEFQKDNVARWMKDFKPRDNSVVAG